METNKPQYVPSRDAPRFRQHGDLELSATKWIEEFGFCTATKTYHECYSVRMQRLLARNGDVTSLYSRAEADRIAVHRSILNCSFQYEVKTQSENGFDDMKLEAFQLARHMLAAKGLGVRVLYIYRTQCGREVGFWSRNVPPIRRVVVPAQGIDLDLYLRARFPNIEFEYRGTVNGSGDPYVLIDRAEVAALPEWRQLVGDFATVCGDKRARGND
jgi:hypothetical protein